MTSRWWRRRLRSMRKVRLLAYGNALASRHAKGRSWRFEDWLVRETNPWQERSQINNWGDKGAIEEEQNENTKTRKTRSLGNGIWVHPVWYEKVCRPPHVRRSGWSKIFSWFPQSQPLLT